MILKWLPMMNLVIGQVMVNDNPPDKRGERRGGGVMENRETTLLRATYELLRKCDEGPYVVNALEQTVFYDEANCDGACLMEDIEILFDARGWVLEKEDSITNPSEQSPESKSVQGKCAVLDSMCNLPIIFSHFFC